MRRLRNLMDGLPPDARCRQVDPDEPQWGWMEELLAQVVEEVGVLAADFRRPEPRTVIRPGVVEVPEPNGRHGGLYDAAVAAGAVRYG